jgi:hypothetical protein
MTINRAERVFQKHRRAIEGNRMMATRQVLGLALGVGASKITAARKMLGLTDGSRKQFIGPLRTFFNRYPGFRIQDAATPETRERFLKAAEFSAGAVT